MATTNSVSQGEYDGAKVSVIPCHSYQIHSASLLYQMLYHTTFARNQPQSWAGASV